MSSKKRFRPWRTLAFRLTLWYTFIFVVSSFLGFVALYWTISSALVTRTDDDLLSEVREFSSIWSQKGLEGLADLVVAEAYSEGINKAFYRILNLSGDPVLASNMAAWADVGVGRNALKHLAEGASPFFETLSTHSRPYPIRIIYGKITADKTLQVGMSLEDDVLFLRALRRKFSIIVWPLIIVSGLVGWFMARHALKGVEKVTETALDISRGAFEQRVQIKYSGEEIQRLATVFNMMLDHISALLKGMREMTDNIAHDLKTPITRIRGMAEMHLDLGKTKDGSSELAADMVEECDYLLQMINTMLYISETEAGALELREEKINMSAVVQKACELFSPLATEKGLKMVTEIIDDMEVTGDLHSLQRMIVNVLENAIKYTPSGGVVSVGLNPGPQGQVRLSVRDTGIGISEQDLPHIFKRLYRCDASRSQPGFGLGLSLALAIARVHGGDITVLSEQGKGSVFEVMLPCNVAPNIA